MKRKQYTPAHELVEELAENLKPKSKKAPLHYIKVFEGPNRRERRDQAQWMQRDLRRFTRWWLRMERLGFDPQELLTKREERERREEDTTTDAA